MSRGGLPAELNGYAARMWDGGGGNRTWLGWVRTCMHKKLFSCLVRNTMKQPARLPWTMDFHDHWTIEPIIKKSDACSQ